MWGSGNRDAAAFDEPDVFDPNRFGDGRRPERPILTFGHGIHLCPGAPLARLQTRIVFEELWHASARSRSRRGTTSATSAARSCAGWPDCGSTWSRRLNGAHPL